MFARKSLLAWLAASAASFARTQFFLRSLAVRDIDDGALDQRRRRIGVINEKRGGYEAPKQTTIEAAEANLAAGHSAFLAQDFHKSFSILRLRVIVQGASPENLFARRAPRKVNKSFVTILNDTFERGEKDCRQIMLKE